MNPSRLSAPALPGQIDWRCMTCGQPTTSGLLHIEHRQVRGAEQTLAEWDHRHGDTDGQILQLGEIMSMPRTARWRVDCDTCRHDCTGCYTIEISLCRSVFALVRWTHHLYGKSWFGATDWIEFIHQVAQDNGSPSETTGVW